MLWECHRARPAAPHIVTVSAAADGRHSLKLLDELEKKIDLDALRAALADARRAKRRSGVARCLPDRGSTTCRWYSPGPCPGISGRTPERTTRRRTWLGIRFALGNAACPEREPARPCSPQSLPRPFSDLGGLGA
jgi:hypothetical protein